MISGLRVPLRSRLAPERALLLLRGEPHPFALLGDWAGGPAILGSAPLRRAEAGEDPFAMIGEQRPASGDAVVGGGWFGWLGYELARTIERLPPPPPGAGPERFALAFHDHLVRFDGERWWFEWLALPGRERAIDARRAHWSRLLETEPVEHPSTAGPFRAAGAGAAGHRLAVADCIERIAAGELFQANLSLRLQASFEGDLVDLAARAFAAARPRFGALCGGVLSLSPERFLRREDRVARTEPIKGTSPRSGNRRADADAKRALLDSAKDAAEHVMIVDLMRNDLGRVCEYGSIVAAAPRPEPHTGVWHLVSTVSGHLRTGIDDGDLLRATFPPGSVTGAPKIRAMRVISELEPHARHAFTGAIGFASPRAGLDLSVAIRAFETDGTRISIDVGGGVVADSTPDGELAEALLKATGPIVAIGAGVATPEGGDAGAEIAQLPRALAFGARPDPAEGLLETVLVRDGVPVALGAHLARLSASAATLLDRALPGDLEELVRAACAGSRGALRLRIVLTAGDCSVTTAPVAAAATHPVVLRPVVLPGGLGAHKWADRSLLDAVTAAFPGETALLVDGDGTVLEAAHANVWTADGDRWRTPRADGRILPGTTRAGLLASRLGSAAEADLTLADLRAAPRLLLTSSIRGAHDAVLAATSS